jgi:hypothetical protein
MHIFMSCNINKQVWYKTGLWNTIRQSVATNNNMAELVFSILQVLTAEQNSLFATTIWSMWQSRNNKLWRNQTETVSAVYDRACMVLTEWQMAHAEHKKSINRRQQQQQVELIRLNRAWASINAILMPPLHQVSIKLE